MEHPNGVHSVRKTILRILIGAVIVVAVPFIVAAFLPREFVVERQIVINRPKSDVFDYVRHLQNQPAFSMWSQIDPKMIKTFRETDGQVGSVYAWDSEEQNVGVGEMEIKRIIEDDRIDFEIRFQKPFQSIDPVFMTTETVSNNETQVKHVYQGKLGYPFNLLCSSISHTVGDGMETTLKNLKTILESPSKPPADSQQDPEK
jgi:uncharacterized protein YndB with AHSA1/START domain